MLDRALNTVKSKFNEIMKPSSNFVIKGREFSEDKLIAEGGYGYVYAVSDSRGQKYALKKMNIISNQQLSNIKREISLWSRVNNGHNIVKLLDYEIGAECVYILMELCTEGNLLDYINNYKGNILEKEALHIIKEILNGINSMHSLSPPISHRDIKIENVLKFGDTYKLCDFGSASTDSMDPRNESKASLGDKFSVYEKNTTFIYRPPEMCDEYLRYIVNEKVDIWAVGCILYTLLFKVHPFQDAQKLTITTAHYYIPDESTRYPPKMMDLIRLLLTPNPSNRPSVNKVIDIIQRWSSVQTIDLPQEVQEIKAKQLKVIKERNASKREITAEELMKAKAAIEKDMKIKHKYKKSNEDDFDDLFDDGDEYYKGNSEKRAYAYNRESNQIKQPQQSQPQPQPQPPQQNNANALLFDFSSGFNNNNSQQSQQQTQVQQRSNNDLGFDFNTGFNNQHSIQNAGFDFSKQSNVNSNDSLNVQFNFEKNFSQKQPSQYLLNQPQQQYLQQNAQYQQYQHPQSSQQYQQQTQQFQQYKPSMPPTQQQQMEPQIRQYPPQYPQPQSISQKNQNILDFFK